MDVDSPVGEEFHVMNASEESEEEQKAKEEKAEEEKAEWDRMMNQARLAYLMSRKLDRRLRRTRTKGMTDMLAEDGIPVELKVHEEQWVVKLTHVQILPWEGELVLGTLEAHANGFRYSARSFHVDIMHANVGNYLFQLGHRGPPLLQFHLRNSIRVGDNDTNDIQFRLFPTGSGHTGKDEQIRDSSRDEDVDNFVRKVAETQWICRSKPFMLVSFEALEFRFEGEFPKGASVSVALTDSALVVLTGTPFTVVPIGDIEIVNLAHHDTVTTAGPMTGPIDMVVVFKDYKRAVFEICSIPLKFLTDIKHRLNFSGVKYYVNCERRNWNIILRDIDKCLQGFKDGGGWASFEDHATRQLYPIAAEARRVLDRRVLERDYVTLW